MVPALPETRHPVVVLLVVRILEEVPGGDPDVVGHVLPEPSRTSMAAPTGNMTYLTLSKRPASFACFTKEMSSPPTRSSRARRAWRP